MLFFDFEKIWLLSGGNSGLIVSYFRGLYFRKPQYASLKGDNFILNPELVVQNLHKLPKRVLAEYLGLCALRNFANYQRYKDTGLDLEYFPDYIPKDVVESNPLIALNKTKLIFKYEE